METHIATRKDHRCDYCGRRIPIGARYFYQDTLKEHSNCLDYKNEDLLTIDYNQNRSKKSAKKEQQNRAYDYFEPKTNKQR